VPASSRSQSTNKVSMFEALQLPFAEAIISNTTDGIRDLRYAFA
jgi:hypothetical protein